MLVEYPMLSLKAVVSDAASGSLESGRGQTESR